MSRTSDVISLQGSNYRFEEIALLTLVVLNHKRNIIKIVHCQLAQVQTNLISQKLFQRAVL